MRPIQGRPLPTPHRLAPESWPDLPSFDTPLIPHSKTGDEGQRRTGMQNIAHLSQKLST
ncbi:MAG: hypothetical protein J7457_09335 [Roseiflexus sp.]|nr:hypothetical protein [Roseiflexus sp.]